MRSGDEDEASLRHKCPSSRPHHTSHMPPSPPPPISSSPTTLASTRATATSGRHHHRNSPSKPNPRLLSLLLQALVMALVIVLFFLFIGIAALVLIHICVASRALHRSRRRGRHRTSTVAPLLEQHFFAFSPMDLHNLSPSFRLTESVSSQDCAVCLEAFREGDTCRILPGCNHFFHSACIDTWLCKASACPVCRRIVQLKD